MRKRALLNLINIKLDLVLYRLGEIERQGESIMSTQQELTAAVNAANAKLVKIGQETTTLLTRIDNLTALLANAPVSAELQAAVDALTAQAQVVDDMVVDEPPL